MDREQAAACRFGQHVVILLTRLFCIIRQERHAVAAEPGCVGAHQPAAQGWNGTPRLALERG